MSNTKIKPAHHCCGIQKEALKKEIQQCDATSRSSQERHQCYRQAARDTRRQAKACMYS